MSGCYVILRVRVNLVEELVVSIKNNMLNRNQYIIVIGVLSLMVFILSVITLMHNRQSTSTTVAPTPTIPLAEPTNITQSRSVDTFPSFPSPTLNPK